MSTNAVGECASPVKGSAPAQGSVCDKAAPNTSSREAARRLLRMYPLLKLSLDEYLRERLTILTKGPSGVPEPSKARKWYGFQPLSDPVPKRVQELEGLELRYWGNTIRVKAVEDVLDHLDEEGQRTVEWHFFNGKSVGWIVAHAEETKLYLERTAIYERIASVLDMMEARMSLWADYRRTTGGQNADALPLNPGYNSIEDVVAGKTS